MGYFLVNKDAPDSQPWLQGANPRPYQEYFDEIYDDILSLRMVPVPKSTVGWYAEIIQGEVSDGRVSRAAPIVLPILTSYLQAMRRILRDHGWPDSLQKDAYLSALLTEHPDIVNIS